MKSSVALAIAIAVAVPSCTDVPADTNSSCVPGESQPCACSSGEMGAQACDLDGLGFAECVCESVVTDTSGTDTAESDSSGDAGTDTDDPYCSKTIDGDVSIGTAEELNQMYGVVAVSGRLSVAGFFSFDTAFECLETVGHLTAITDFSDAFAGLQSAQSVEFRANDQSAELTLFDQLQLVGDYTSITLIGYSGGGFPLVDVVDNVRIERGCTSLSAEVGTLHVSNLEIADCLEGTVAATAKITNSPVMPASLLTGPVTIEGAETLSLNGLHLANELSRGSQLSSLRVSGTGISSLPAFPTTSFEGGIHLQENADLDNISALTGVEVPNSSQNAVIVTGAPGVCQDHFDGVTSTITTDGSFLLSGSEC